MLNPSELVTDYLALRFNTTGAAAASIYDQNQSNAHSIKKEGIGFGSCCVV